MSALTAPLRDLSRHKSLAFFRSDGSQSHLGGYSVDCSSGRCDLVHFSVPLHRVGDAINEERKRVDWAAKQWALEKRKSKKLESAKWCAEHRPSKLT
jgi:hypothetical protein